jgi:hypothetical protein
MSCEPPGVKQIEVFRVSRTCSGASRGVLMANPSLDPCARSITQSPARASSRPTTLLPSAQDRLNPPSQVWDFPKSFPTAEKRPANRPVSTSSTSSSAGGGTLRGFDSRRLHHRHESGPCKARAMTTRVGVRLSAGCNEPHRAMPGAAHNCGIARSDSARAAGAVQRTQTWLIRIPKTGWRW